MVSQNPALKDLVLREIQILLLSHTNAVDIHNKGVKVATVVGHRRCGKTFGVVLSLLSACVKLYHETEIVKLRKDVDSWSPQFAFLAETRSAARDIVWGSLQRFFSHFPGVKFNNARLVVEIPRPYLGDTIQIHLKSHRYHDSLRGMKFRRIYLDEGQRLTETGLTESIFPTLSDSAGDLCITGTASPLGWFKDHTVNAVKRNACHILPATMTGVFTPTELQDIENEIGTYAYDVEYLCSFDAPMKGSFYAEELARIENKDWFKRAFKNAGRATLMAVDIGVGEGFAAWIAQVSDDGKEIHILDYYSNYELLSVLKNDLIQDGNVPDVVFVPHDGGTKRLEAVSRRTSHDVFSEVFDDSVIVPLDKSKNRFLDIEQVLRHLYLLRFPPERDALGKPFPTDAWRGFSLLKLYKRKIDKDNRLLDVIEKNGSEHTADALRYLFMGLQVEEGRAHLVPEYRRNRRVEVVTNRTRRNPLLVNKRSKIGERSQDEVMAMIERIKVQSV